MDSIFSVLKDITKAGFSVWMFLSFGLPFILSIIALFVCGFEEGSLFSWRGRMNRRSYLVNLIVIIFTTFISAFIFFYGMSNHYTVIFIFGAVTFLCSIFRSFAILARRLHDFNFSGMFGVALYLMSLVLGGFEFIRLLILFIDLLILIWPGDKLENKYGTAPISKVSF